MRHLLFICLLLFCVACEENESVDPTIIPGRIHLVAWLTAGCIQAAGGGCLLRNIWSGKRVPA